MPTPNKSSFLSSSIYIFLLRFFPTAAFFISWVFLSRHLPLSDYGAYQSWWIYFLLFTSLAGIGLPSLLLTYHPGQIAFLFQQIKVRSIAYFGLLVLGLAVLCIYLQANVQSNINPIWSLIFFISSVTLLLAESYLIALKKIKLISCLSIVYSFLFVGLHLRMLQSGFDLQNLIQSLTLLMLVRLGIVWARVRLLQKNNSITIEALDMVQTRSLWTHLAIQDILQYIFKWIDKVLVVALLSSTLTAIYFNGAIDIPFLPILLGAFTSAGLLYLAQVQSTDKQQHSIALLHKTGVLLNAMVMPLFLFLLFFAAPLFDLLFDHRYAASVPIFQWSILVLPLRAYGFTSILQHAHKGALINKGALLDLVIALALLYPLYRLMGLPGLAFSFVLSSYVQAAYYSIHTAKILQVKLIELFPLKLWLQQFLLSFAIIYVFKIGSCYFPCSISYLVLVAVLNFLFNILFLWMKKTSIQ